MHLRYHILGIMRLCTHIRPFKTQDQNVPLQPALNYYNNVTFNNIKRHYNYINVCTKSCQTDVHMYIHTCSLLA